jgi:hypothetical protein
LRRERQKLWFDFSQGPNVEHVLLASVVDEVAGDLDALHADGLDSVPFAFNDGRVQSTNHRFGYMRNLFRWGKKII